MSEQTFICVVPDHSVDRFLDLLATGEASVDRVLRLEDVVKLAAQVLPDERSPVIRRVRKEESDE